MFSGSVHDLHALSGSLRAADALAPTTGIDDRVTGAHVRRNRGMRRRRPWPSA
jgi:hypothetical protein